MPQLSRIHFASIGHPDARLSPLHIDLRDEKETPADSVLWLRNGGGKSSILNLFYSLFRPNRRDFLGAKAEGKARHLEEYVLGKDLAAVLTEWQFPAPKTLFAQHDKPSRLIIGQALAWQGARVSHDHDKLKRIFFSFRGGYGLELEDLPFQGLHGSIGSLDELEQWFNEVAARMPQAEITTQRQHKRWGEHLDRLQLDPELFKYQLKMNEREGAADEQFRFGTSQDFIRFFLELTSEDHQAKQLTDQLETLRERLGRKPDHEREVDFLSEAIVWLEQLSRAVGENNQAKEQVEKCLERATLLAGGLTKEVERLTLDGGEKQGAINEQKRNQTSASNEAKSRHRWAAGLKRKALEVKKDELELALTEAQQKSKSHEQMLGAIKAATELIVLRPLRVKYQAIKEELEKEQREHAPLIKAEAQAASSLVWHLEKEMKGLEDEQQAVLHKQEKNQSDTRLLKQKTKELDINQGSLKTKIATLEEKISARNRSRQQLNERELLEARESIDNAIGRFKKQLADLAYRHSQLGDEKSELTLRRDASQQEERRLSKLLSEQQSDFGRCKARLDEGLKERDRLQASKALQDLEESESFDVSNLGLQERLTTRIKNIRAKILVLKINSAEDLRALESIKDTELLPPPRDAERLVDALDELEVTAYTAFQWMVQNTLPNERLGLLLGDPGRYTGVIVQKQSDLEAIDGLGQDLANEADLNAPVQISLAAESLASSASNDASRRVIPPVSEGAWNVEAANRRTADIKARQEKQQTQVDIWQAESESLQSLAHDVARFQSNYGEKQLEKLRNQVDALQRQAENTIVAVETQQMQQAQSQRRLLAIADEKQELLVQQKLQQQGLAALEEHQRHHESRIEDHRDELHACSGSLQKNQLEAQALESDLEELQLRADKLQKEAIELELHQKQLGEQRSKHGLLKGEPNSEVLDLASAKALWRLHKDALEQKRSKSNLAGQIEGLEPILEGQEAQFTSSLAGHNESEVVGLANLGERLLTQKGQDTQAQVEKNLQRMGQLKAQVNTTKNELQKQGLQRREASDLPPVDPLPTDSEGLQSLAKHYEDEGRQCHEQAKRAERQIASLERQHNELRRHLDLLKSQCERLTDATQEEPSPQGIEVPQTGEAIRQQVNHHIGELKVARASCEERQRAAQQLAEKVRAFAVNERYAKHRSKAKERLKDTPEQLMKGAGQLLLDMGGRRTVVASELQAIVKDQSNLVASLDSLGEDALRQLNRAQSVSKLPKGLGDWSERAYLQIKVDVPKLKVERHALLTHMVEQLVQKGTLPSGMTLLQQVVQSLAGADGFKVTILKPDAARRPNRLPITDMSTFSRGQQLTAAILLYCTLVKLRARTRGKAESDNAGSLILDNPIGTCSSVPLMNLQRDFAQKMGVQLIYTTGVRDLDALATLPNIVRLRNTHRERSTGNQHVTLEPDSEGIEAARVHHRGDSFDA